MRTRFVAAVALVLALAGPGLAQEESPSVRERAYARLLAERMGEPPVEPTRVRLTSRSGQEARGLRVQLPGLTAARLRFDTPAQAQAFADGLDGQGVVEVRGKQVVLLRGPRAGEPGLLDAAWELLPAPASSGAVRALADAPGAAATAPAATAPAPVAAAPVAPAPVAAAQAGSDAHGVSELLRHHLMGEALRPLRQRTSSPRERVEAAVAAVSTSTMGKHQSGRVLPAYDALTPADRARLDALLERFATQPAVRDQLLKALAASSSVDDVEWLGEQLDGKAPEWIAANTRLTGDDGVKQQFHDSCAATMAQALRGEYDPVYSLRTRQDNTDVHQVDEADAYKINAALAAEQERKLETPYAGLRLQNHGMTGEAVPRNSYGAGTIMEGQVHDLKEETGLDFGYLGTYEDHVAPADAIAALQTHLSEGRVVPMSVYTPGAGGHAVLATSVRTDEAGEPSFLVFDPWEGRSQWVPAQQIRDGTMDVAGHANLRFLLVPEVVK